MYCFCENVDLMLYSIERYTEIERENRILLEKMSNIMQNPKPQLYTPSNPCKLNKFEFLYPILIKCFL